MVILWELLLTTTIGLGLAAGLFRLGSALRLSLPADSGQRTIFLIGIVLFALTFRLFWFLKQEGEN